MALPRILRAFNLFFDGRGYAGKIDELELPKLSLKTEEHQAGGMDAPVEIDMGMEKLEATITLADFDENIITFFGLANGAAAQITARGGLAASDGTVTPVVVNLRGAVKELDPGSWKAGEKATLKFTIGVRYYRYESAGATLLEIDIENMVRNVGGIDQLADLRAAIGV